MAALLSVALILLFVTSAVALLMGDRAPLMTTIVVAMVVFLIWTAWSGGTSNGCGVLCRAVSVVVVPPPDQAIAAQNPLPPPPQEAVRVLAQVLNVPVAVVQSTLSYTYR